MRGARGRPPHLDDMWLLWLVWHAHHSMRSAGTGSAGVAGKCTSAYRKRDLRRMYLPTFEDDCFKMWHNLGTSSLLHSHAVPLLCSRGCDSVPSLIEHEQSVKTQK